MPFSSASSIIYGVPIGPAKTISANQYNMLDHSAEILTPFTMTRTDERSGFLNRDTFLLRYLDGIEVPTRTCEHSQWRRWGPNVQHALLASSAWASASGADLTARERARTVRAVRDLKVENMALGVFGWNSSNIRISYRGPWLLYGCC